MKIKYELEDIGSLDVIGFSQSNYVRIYVQLRMRSGRKGPLSYSTIEENTMPKRLRQAL